MDDLTYDGVPYDTISERGSGNYYVFKDPGNNKAVPIVYIPREHFDVIYGSGKMSRNSKIRITIERVA
ncbi:MAG: hypothetical protein F4X11_19750 [Acidobacteria bacterium]|nr:hypothetical protein [Acidobacteriota bacterium]